MARILYGIAGEGMGHAIRSKVIIKELSKMHDVVIVSSGRAYKYLSETFPKVHQIHGFHIDYKDNKVLRTKTFLSNFLELPSAAYKTIIKLRRMIKKSRPDVIISDFEPFTAHLSRIYNIRLASIDNMSIITNCKIEISRKSYEDYITAKAVIKSFMPKADNYLITTFFYPAIKERNTKLYPPILRDEILRIKPKKKDFVLVYQTSKENSCLRKNLFSIDEKFVLYGYDINKEEKNVKFKKFDEEQFINDLASCKALITNGGFTTITEAIHLGKPVLSEPIKKQFEQALNGLYIQKKGYGMYCKKIDSKKIKEFLSKQDIFEKRLKGYEKKDNEEILRNISEIVTRP